MKFRWISAFIFMSFSLSISGGIEAVSDRAIGEIKEPVMLDKSPFLGLTERQVLKTARVSRLEREKNSENRKFFSIGPSSIPELGGYLYSRFHLLTFQNGKVVRHEIVDRSTACVITEFPVE